jgi:serine/threonine protein kinase
VAAAGDRIGAYEVVRLIARGGMAIVYEARQPALDRAVALKELELRVDDTTMLDRFIQESRLSASFDHPNIVVVYDFFEVEGVPYIAMEYLPRGSLRPYVGKLTHPQVFGVLEGMLAALAHAEHHGVAHRDLKPENVMITRGGAVKLTDFGIAKAYTRATAAFTAAGMAVGTPVYMAPEQAMSEQVGPFTDLYAVGVMAYELLSGAPPFEGGESPVSVMYKHVSEPPPPLQDVEPRVAAWVARMLEKKPDDRPPGAAAAWADLEEIIVDILGPYWRRDAKLGELTPLPSDISVASPPESGYVAVAGGEDEDEERPAPPMPDDAIVTPAPSPPPPPEGVPPAPDDLEEAPPSDEYVTVAGDARTRAPEPEPEPVAPPEPEPVAPPEPEPEVVAEPEPVAPPPPDPQPEVVAEREEKAVETPVTAPITRRPPDEPTPPPSPGRRRAVITALVLAGVAAVVVAALVLTGGGDDNGGGGGGGGGGGPTTDAAVPYDFDGDGTPTTTVGVPNAGSVVVRSLDEPLTAPDAGPESAFGTAIAGADFNSDGRGDLAIGAPGADSVTVMYSPEEGGIAQAEVESLPGGGRFGAALAAGDLDGDGFPDLAAGAPDGEGIIRVFYGGRDGLSGDRTATIEPGDGLTGGFGGVLAIGDVNGDDRLDLAEAGGSHSSYCPGAARGDMECFAMGEDLDGEITALAVGDLTGDDLGEIVQGLPQAGEPVIGDNGVGPVAPPGRVRIWLGEEDGPAAEPTPLTQEDEGVGGNDQARDEWGGALAIADLGGDDLPDLVVGSPGEDEGLGRVTIVHIGEDGRATERGRGYGAASGDVPVELDGESRFGASIAVRDTDGNGDLDLIAAVPGNAVVVTMPGTGGDEFVTTGATTIDLPEDAAGATLGAP